ncbi:hypothetical protein, partial [Acinetobacter bereziniae]|uniref:hypothetical protein n=2 Tax=Acinetobacter bereziniae TaxID=106648 RepID=UPI00377017EF
NNICHIYNILCDVYHKKELIMSIQNKKLTLMAISVCLLVVGCGSGGDSSSSNSSNSTTTEDNLENGTRYYFVDYELNDDSDNLTMEYYEVFNKQFKNLQSNTSLDEYILTANKLYTPRDIATNKVILNSTTSWTSTLIGDVKTDIKLEKVDISGRNIFDTVLPGYRSLGFDNENNYGEARKLLASYGKENFPKGSNCYRIISTKNNQDYFSFETNQEFNQDFEDFNQDNIGYVDYLNEHYKPLGLSYRYESGNWQGIPWTTIYEIELGIGDEDAVAVKYQNKTYLAEYNSRIEWTNGKEIRQWENLLGRTTTDKERIPKLNIERLKNGCTVYNSTAASTLSSLKLIDWN